RGCQNVAFDKEPPNSILTWDDLVSKFINFFFPPSKTTNLRNEITNFRQIAQESFSEAWERFKELLRKCPHHGFSLIHQLDTFYNSLSYNNRNVNANQGYNRTGNNGNQVNHGANSGLTQQAQAYQAPSTQVPVTYARFEAYTKANDVTLNNLQKNLNDFKREQQDFQNEQRNFQNMMLNMFQKQMGNNNASGSGTLPSNTIPNPRNEVKAITTRSGLAYDGPLPPMPPPYVNLDNEDGKETEVTKDQVQPTSSQSTARVQPPVVQNKEKVQNREKEPIVEPRVVNEPFKTKTNLPYLIDKEEFFLPKSPPIKPNKPTKTLPYPSRVEYEKKGENDKVQIQKFWEMFKKIHVNITLADALILMPKYQKMLKSLLSNKEKLNEMANTPVSENCSAIILKKLPEKLEDPGQFSHPVYF
ncbi:reverse transcriptase domain-containing protein, partial [Tanacetum coccineum]